MDSAGVRFSLAGIGTGEAGDNIGVLLRGIERANVERGQVLAKPGSIIIRQRGTYFLPGQNVGLGVDHTIFATTAGRVHFRNRRKTGYNSQTRVAKEVSVLPVI